MSLSLSASLVDHVHLAWIGRDIVTLNVRDDAYGLIVDGAAIVLSKEGRRIETEDRSVLTALLDAGLVQTSAPPLLPFKLAMPAITALRPGEQQKTRRPAPAVCRRPTVWVATTIFKRASFSDLLTCPPTKRRRLRRSGSLAQTYAAFDAALPWLPFEGQCLQRAFLLRRHLEAHGYAADWILGVRTLPFLAHSWVQVGSVVVGDSLERVRGFTPILTV